MDYGLECALGSALLISGPVMTFRENVMRSERDIDQSSAVVKTLPASPFTTHATMRSQSSRESCLDFSSSRHFPLLTPGYSVSSTNRRFSQAVHTAPTRNEESQATSGVIADGGKLAAKA